MSQNSNKSNLLRVNVSTSPETQNPVIVHQYTGEAPKHFDNHPMYPNAKVSPMYLMPFLATLIQNKRVDPKQACLLVQDVDSETPKITFRGSDLVHTIVANSSFELTPDLVELGLNSGKLMSVKEFVKLIQLRKHLFDNPELHAPLIGKFMKMNIRIDKSINSELNDGSGNVSLSEKILLNIDQETDLIREFVLKMPIYKGFQAVQIPVQIQFDAESGSLKLFLQSLDLPLIRKRFIDDQIAAITSFTTQHMMPLAIS